MAGQDSFFLEQTKKKGVKVRLSQGACGPDHMSGGQAAAGAGEGERAGGSGLVGALWGGQGHVTEEKHLTAGLQRWEGEPPGKRALWARLWCGAGPGGEVGEVPTELILEFDSECVCTDKPCGLAGEEEEKVNKLAFINI